MTINMTPYGPIGTPDEMRPRLELWRRQQAALEAGEDPTLTRSIETQGESNHKKTHPRGGLPEIRSGVLIRPLLAPSASSASRADPIRRGRWRKVGERLGEARRLPNYTRNS